MIDIKKTRTAPGLPNAAPMEIAEPEPPSGPAGSRPVLRGLPPGILLETSRSELAAPAIIIDGRQLRRWRRHYGLSQEKLAYQAGISITTVARLERQSRASCRGYTLGRLATALAEQAAAITAPEPDHRTATDAPGAGHGRRAG
jgi:DNA-binding XRE family transcriptional regulator